MKGLKSVLGIVVFLMAFSTHATVAQLMEESGRTYKSITTKINQGQFGPVLIQEIERLQVLSAQARDIVPGSFDHLSETARSELYVKYKADMQIMVSELEILRAAAANADKAAALASIKRLSASKAQGHDNYKAP